MFLLVEFAINKKNSDALTFVQHFEEYSYQYFQDHRLDRYLGDPYLSSTPLLFIILLTDHMLLKTQNIKISDSNAVFDIDEMFHRSLNALKRLNYDYLAAKTEQFLKQPDATIALLSRTIYKGYGETDFQIIDAYNTCNIIRFKKCLAIVDKNNYRNALDPLFKAMHD